jgi:ferritin-like metal-binding protein YciE
MVSDRSVEELHAFASEMGLRLDSMMTTTDAPELTEMLKRHQEETECHERRLRERLDALGVGTSTRKQAQTIATALMKGAADQVRGDQAGKNARDDFTTENMEIAAYQLLERLAERAGDPQTAEVARKNRADDEAMARKIDANWDRFLDLTLAENDISAYPDPLPSSSRPGS